jgi:hypothetical protein
MFGIEFGIAVGVAALLGLAVHIASCIWHKKWPPIDKIVEAMFFGAAVAIGVRMMCGAFYAEMLCCAQDELGKPFVSAGMHLTFAEHTAEIIAGGACIVLASIYSLGWVWRFPVHQKVTQSPTT